MNQPLVFIYLLLDAALITSDTICKDLEDTTIIY
jgi:hypothetical protein